MSVAGIVAVSCLLLTNDAVRDVPFHATTELLLKLLPFMVRTKPAPPAVALLGEIDVSDGVEAQEQETTGSRNIANAPKRGDLLIVFIVIVVIAAMGGPSGKLVDRQSARASMRKGFPRRSPFGSSAALTTQVREAEPAPTTLEHVRSGASISLRLPGRCNPEISTVRQLSLTRC